ncbi:MAG: ATP phosphoribosyltransferase [Deinococcales bacterium]
MQLTIAIPSGERSKQFALSCLRHAGLVLPDLEQTRSLRLEHGNLTLLLVKDPDVPVYVDLGAADCGIVGQDHILESGRDNYEPVNLGGNQYRFSLITLAKAPARIERVATKYPRATRQFLRQRGMAADVIALGGKIELAAITGLADAVVDIVETGRTLQENGLIERERLLELSTRFIVNRAALKLKAKILRDVIHSLEAFSATMPT